MNFCQFFFLWNNMYIETRNILSAQAYDLLSFSSEINNNISSLKPSVVIFLLKDQSWQNMLKQVTEIPLFHWFTFLLYKSLTTDSIQWAVISASRGGFTL